MELITLETVQANPLAVFTAENGLDPYLAPIKAEVDAFIPDMSTDKGRKEIASFAHKIARARTTLDTIGKDLKASIMEQPKQIDAERRRVREILEGWQAQVRAPLTEFEEAEKARIAEIQSRIDGITALPEQLKEHGASSEVIDKKIKEIINETFDYQDLKPASDGAKMVAITKLNNLRLEAKQAEAIAKEAELKRLEDEKAAQAEREAQIKAEAEARAQAEIEAAKQKAEQERLDADRKAKEEAARIKAESEATIRRAEEAQKLADERAKQAEENAKLEAQRAVEAEKRRVAQEERDKADVEAQRKASEDNQRRVNREALDSMIKCGFEEATAKKIIGAIAKGEIKNISINY